MESNNLEPKPAFEERMRLLLDGEKDYENFLKICYERPVNSIRVNTLKISVEELKNKLEKKGWKINQPFKDFPEIFIVENKLLPGEIGKSEEHLLGYFYVQEISSMMPLILLNPSEEERILDLCASPGSKTTQASAMMKNSGTLIANDGSLGRFLILCANLERCGASNVFCLQKEGSYLCKEFEESDFRFDKILLDAPCSGEGIIRSNPKTFLMWNEKQFGFFARTQRKLSESAMRILKVGGEMVYSTCTHAPEENEEIIQNLLDKFDIKIEKTKLPLRTRQGISSWKEKKFSNEIQNCHRIYPQDNNTEGFFLCKIKKLSDKEK